MNKSIEELELIKYFNEKIQIWGKENIRSFPWRKNSDPYRILVTEILLQQTISIKVARLYDKFFEKYPTIEFLALADEEELKELIYDLGFHYRAKLLIEIAKTIKEKGEIPKEKAKLMELKGIGDYISSATLIFAFNKNVPLLDTNTRRIVVRFWGLEGKGVNLQKQIKNKLRRVGNSNLKYFYWIMLDFGALVCKSPNPKCNNCILRTNCNFNNRNI